MLHIILTRYICIVYQRSSKYLKGYNSAQFFPYKVHSRDITQKTNKREQPFLHVTPRLDLIYMPTKYYQNISKDIKVIECTSFYLRMDRRTPGWDWSLYPPNLVGRGIKRPAQTSWIRWDVTHHEMLQWHYLSYDMQLLDMYLSNGLVLGMPDRIFSHR